VVISGSHGGRSAAEFVIALPQKPRCVCYSHLSARIGDAQDGYDQGRVSGINALAQSQGIELNMTVQQALKLLN
jgi:hypothetical protein